MQRHEVLKGVTGELPAGVLSFVPGHGLSCQRRGLYWPHLWASALLSVAWQGCQVLRGPVEAHRAGGTQRGLPQETSLHFPRETSRAKGSPALCDDETQPMISFGEWLTYFWRSPLVTMQSRVQTLSSCCCLVSLFSKQQMRTVSEEARLQVLQNGGMEAP